MQQAGHVRRKPQSLMEYGFQNAGYSVKEMQRNEYMKVPALLLLQPSPSCLGLPACAFLSHWRFGNERGRILCRNHASDSELKPGDAAEPLAGLGPRPLPRESRILPEGGAVGSILSLGEDPRVVGLCHRRRDAMGVHLHPLCSLLPD